MSRKTKAGIRKVGAQQLQFWKPPQPAWKTRSKLETLGRAFSNMGRHPTWSSWPRGKIWNVSNMFPPVEFLAKVEVSAVNKFYWNFFFCGSAEKNTSKSFFQSRLLGLKKNHVQQISTFPKINSNSHKINLWHIPFLRWYWPLFRNVAVARTGKAKTLIILEGAWQWIGGFFLLWVPFWGN